MSIKLKDTIYDLINNSDKLDGKDSSAFSLTTHTHSQYLTELPSHSHNYVSIVKIGSTSYNVSNNIVTLPSYPTLSSLGAASSSHTHNYAGSDTAGGGANSVKSTGFGSGNFTWYQSSSSFFGSNWTSGWASYLISNHGDGSSYYNYTIALPFWTYPYYKRMTGSTSSTAGWYYFVTQENIGSMSVNYANSAGNSNTVDGYHISVGTSAGVIQVRYIL